MEKRFDCDVAEKEAKDFLDISDRYNALERLVMMIIITNIIPQGFAHAKITAVPMHVHQ